MRLDIGRYNTRKINERRESEKKMRKCNKRVNGQIKNRKRKGGGRKKRKRTTKDKRKERDTRTKMKETRRQIEKIKL